jgi:3-dehydroquinate synthase
MTTQTAQTTASGITVPVDLGERAYDILIEPGLISRAGTLIAPHLKRPVTAIVSDENVANLHLAALEASLDAADIAHSAIILPAGEATKSYANLALVCDRLLAAGIERNDTILAFGGGVIGDLAGFAAAIVRRGINFIQIPTSLLAQVDSSVGGKTGINSPLGKNLIGAFHQPVQVLADINLLDTLPPREFAAGYAEVAKYGLLGNAGFFSWLEDNAAGMKSGDLQARMHAVEASCRAKADVVARDEREAGVRALLNLGHTFGHALEAATGYGDTLLHGEGVAIGMVMAFRFSEQLGLCAAGTAERVAAHLRTMDLPVSTHHIIQALPDADTLMDIMRQDKKSEGGRMVFILARAIGEAFVARDVGEAAVRAFLQSELEAS